jgi:hypothetical protein
MRIKVSPLLEWRPNEAAPRQDLERSGDASLAPRGWQIRFLCWAFSAAVNLIIIAALFWPYAAPPPPRRAQASIQVSLIESPRPPDPPKFLQPTAPRLVTPAVMIATSMPDTSDLLSESQLAGAANAGEGGNGGGCNMAGLVQQALRRDPLVHMAVEDAHRLGNAIMLWNGDWVRSGEQDGKGLSAVREAIMWEVAFAPQTCRNQRVQGLVLLSLADGSTRFAIGAGDWRWSDLLGVRGVLLDR